MDDVKSMIISNYCNFDNEEVYDITTYGRYFPEICKHPEKYIQKNEVFVDILEKLRSEDKMTFLLTNSHVQYTELIMKHSLGDDW